MPRPKDPNRSGSIWKRTRSGCRQCRARKVKCDEGRPSCTRCADRRSCCEYGEMQLKWQSDYLSSGRAFGRQGLWTKGKSGSCMSPRQIPGDGSSAASALGISTFIENYHFVHTFYSDMQRSAHDESCLSPQPSALITVAPSPGNLCPGTHTWQESLTLSRPFIASRIAVPRTISPYLATGGFDPGLLEYYFLRICPLAKLSRNSSSPFIELITPLIDSGCNTLGILSAMAFSARHLSLLDDRWSSAALYLKGRTLATLRESLGASDDKISFALQSSTIPIAMMFLCLYEIIDNCDDRWVIHLRASQDFLHRRKQLASLLDHETEVERSQVSLAERFFAFQDAISRTACGNSSVFSLDYWQSTDRVIDQQGWMGCSTKLAGVLFRTTELGRMRIDMSPGELEIRISSLERELACLTVDEYDIIECLIRESARLYQHCLLRDATPSTPSVVEIVHRVLQELHSLTHESDSFPSGLAFPLFIAAAELDPLRDEAVFYNQTTGAYLSGRRLVLDIIHKVSTSCLFNMKRIGDVICQIWATRDLHLAKRPGGLQVSGTQNDWNFFVSPHCTNLSLA